MSNNGHPRHHRLLTAGDFRYVFDNVDVKAAFPQGLFLARFSQSQQARLGFIISKKNLRTAVARNRVKRLARETFRLHYADMPPLDIILLARPGLDTLSNEELVTILRKQFHRLKKRWKTHTSEQKESTSEAQ